MGFRYRKSLNLGPFRVNVGTGGVGFSIGGRGLRSGVSSRGRRYTTFGIPGTGMSYHHTHGRRGCLWWLVLAVGLCAAGCFSAARILP
jgi:hypothetical protein